MLARSPILALTFLAVNSGPWHYAEAAEKDKPSFKRAIDAHDKVFLSEARDPEALKDVSPRVKIALRLTPFQSNGVGVGVGEGAGKAIAEPTLRYTLRAKLLKSNHFYFDKFHVQTVPLSWRKDSGIYKVKLVIHRRYSPGVEESLGSIEVRGVLQGEGDVFTLEGTASQTFRDKWGEPVLSVVTGFPAQNEASEIRVAEPTSQ